MSNGGGISAFPREPGGGGFAHIRSMGEMDSVPPLPQDAEIPEAEAIGEEQYREPPPPPDRENAKRLIRWSDPTKTLNICDEILANVQDGESLLGRIGMRVVREYEIDLQSRSAWETRMQKALNLAMQIVQGKSTPWENASNIVFPLVATAAIQFNARAFPAVVQGADVVKGIVVGDDSGVPMFDPRTGQIVLDNNGQPAWQVKPGEKRRRATRVAEHMSWQFTQEQPEWIEETDRLLIMLPIIGCMFRKTFFDMQAGRNSSVLASAKDVVLNYWAKSVDTAPRISELLKLYPYELLEEERAGTFRRDVQYGLAEGALDGDEDAPHTLIEQHRRWDLDGDGYPEPIVVTVHKQTSKVVRIVARFDPEGIRPNKDTNEIQRVDQVNYYTKYDFLPSLDGGIYGMGLGQLLNPINEAVNTTLNQMFDAETLRIHGGGFLGKGLGMKSGLTKFRLGEWKVVNALGSTIKDSVVPIQHQGANEVLFQLLGFLIEAGKELASNTEVLSGNQSKGNVPATTTLALIEQGLKVFTAVYKRIYLAEQSEFLKQYRLNRLYLNNSTQYQRGEEWRTVTREDYTQNTGIVPVADPSMVSDMQKLARAEVLEKYREDPEVNRKEVVRRVFEYAQIDEIDQLLQANQPPDPLLLKKLQIEEMGKKADVLFKMSGAMLNLAKMDEVVAGIARGEVQQGMDQERLGMDKDRAAMDMERGAAEQEQMKAQTRSIDVGAMTQWINTQMETLKGQVELLGAEGNDGSAAAAAKPRPNGGGAGGRGSRSANGGGSNGLGMGSLAAASGNQAAPALPR